ncbi:UDP-N-acetylmuramate:L-alanyl-gamma-D-glutamyl-meso-diaminopimelate ligase [Roseibacillus ishigakijimensis]|uniref:UDP-N-acetylmuramate:L-alanyl-gamma-D-glutamyl- meso-diaminopimelate ligase n=1 Tax=Roseibacillus ishigakijimensis TaxID=454146 RepID=UPI0027DC06A9|nr:UDP-N-acetylmuramate:L-alanyl-gamma-D-glutamyl-meso-diaminopimelate ligase [Roseibacillus ishigakijimensis]
MRHFHFIGICGTAMGSVAAAMKRAGFEVTGSDANVYPPMSTFLESEGIELFEGYRRENIPASADTIIVGNAVSRGNEEAEEVLDRKLLYQSLPEVLKEHFLRGKRNLVIAGTHGKTTTSSLVAWLLKAAGRNPSHMIGGVPKNFERGAEFTDSEFVVLEGDEYDTAFFDKRSKFLHYLPEVAVINNIEFDHADIYADLDAVLLTFSRLLRIVPGNGVAFLNGDCANSLTLVEAAPCPIQLVGMGENCQVRISEITGADGGTSFQLNGESFFLPMTGEFNVRNAAMAVCVARQAGLSEEEIREGLASFAGIKRRQEVRGEVRGVTVIDDFAHHPTAVEQVIDGLRQGYPGRRLLVILEPRSNTMRQEAHKGNLAGALAKADLAVVPPVLEVGQIAQEALLDVPQLIADINAAGGDARSISNVEDIVAWTVAEAREGDLVAVLSNGGFGGIHPKLLEALASS